MKTDMWKVEIWDGLAYILVNTVKENYKCVAVVKPEHYSVAEEYGINPSG
jgi:hypothetical protein